MKGRRRKSGHSLPSIHRRLKKHWGGGDTSPAVIRAKSGMSKQVNVCVRRDLVQPASQDVCDQTCAT